MAASVQDAIEEFKERVRRGKVLDRYGNRLCFYEPADDTFFSCMSHAQCGDGNAMREEMRHRLLGVFVERATGAPCYDVRQWNPEGDFEVCDSAFDDPAVKSLAMTRSGIVGNEDALLQYMQGDDFRADVAYFVHVNQRRDGTLYCRYVFAYLYCDVYGSDVTFYQKPADGDEVAIEFEISKVCGSATAVMHANTWEMGRHNRGPLLYTPRAHDEEEEEEEDSSSTSASLSDQEDSNWHITYLLYTGDRFQLMYTPNIEEGAEQQIRRSQRYQLRVCYVDGMRGRVNSEPLEGRPAYLRAPPKGWKVHSYLLAPDELHPRQLYQVNGREARGMHACGIPMNKSLFVYLYYKDIGGQPMALFVSAIAGGLAPEPPLFVLESSEDQVADGVLVTVARRQQQASRRVQLEARTRVLETHRQK